MVNIARMYGFLVFAWNMGLKLYRLFLFTLWKYLVIKLYIDVFFFFFFISESVGNFSAGSVVFILYTTYTTGFA